MGRRQPAQQAIPWSYPGHSPGHGWAARGLYPPLDIVVLPPCPKSLDLRISHTGGNINCPMHFIRLQIKLYTTNPDQRDQRTHLAIVVAGTGEERTLPGEEEPWDSERRPRFRLPRHAPALPPPRCVLLDLDLDSRSGARGESWPGGDNLGATGRGVRGWRRER